MENLTLSELEDAINYWRGLHPATGEERALAHEVDVLATIYALMIVNKQKIWPADQLEAEAREYLEVWRAQVTKI